MNERVELFRFEHLSRAGGVVHGVSGRQGGVSRQHLASLNVSLSVADEPDLVFENRRRLAAALSVPAESLLKPRQVHGTTCLLVGPEALAIGGAGLGDTALAADALLTAAPGVALFMTFADCVPILLHDPRRGVVGVVHAGWQGTVGGAVREAVRTAQRELGCRPADWLVGIGPSIGLCCYEVGEEVAAAAERALPGCSGLLRPGAGARPHLDLWRANLCHLREAGVPEAQVEVMGLCTACHTDLFYSHRREGGRTGRMGAVIGLAEDGR